MERRAIPGFPGYTVSQTGTVYSDKSGRALKAWEQGNGYLKVTLYLNGLPHKCYLHELVLLAFVGPRPSGMKACHRDDNRKNNAAVNLRWDTHHGNMADAVRKGHVRSGERVHFAKLRKSDVDLIRKLRASGSSMQSLADRFGVSIGNIHAIVHAKSWKR